VLGVGEADAQAFGRLFLANPDLPHRFALKAPLNPWNTATCYGEGPTAYRDYPTLAAAAE
jgi:2,4-dienoyl-CoA reductase-like NADH-dependent reductase (Old Yellow Enzyme family)